MQAAKYWRNRRLRYRLIMMEGRGNNREAPPVARRRLLNGDRQPGARRVKALS